MMNLKKIIIIAAGLALIALSAAAFLFRPVTIQDGAKTISIRPAAWTVGQALSSARYNLDPHDRVSPNLDQPVPLNGKIIVERAVQAYLWEDGQMRSIQGLARTPRELLDSAGVQLQASDRLLWNGELIALDTPLPTGRPILLQLDHARVLQLDQSGQRIEIDSHAPTTAGALWEAGVKIGPGDWLSVGAGSLFESDTVIGYQAARPILIQTGGQEIQVNSAAETVGAALAETGTSLQGLDYSQPAEDQPVPPDGRVLIVRVREEILLTESLVAYESQFAPDPDLELDQVRPMQSGQYGVQVVRERMRFEDGQEISRTFDSDWVAANPVPETIGYGTKVVTQTEDTPDGTIEYWRKIRVYATSYSPCRLGIPEDRCGYITASGMRLTKGVVAVSLSWFRMMRGQQVYIPGYGLGVIADYGALRGMWIDLGFDEENFEEGAIVGYVDMYFLTPIPATIPWTLP